MFCFSDNIDLKLKRPLLLPQDIQPAAESFFNTLPNQADVRNRSGTNNVYGLLSVIVDIKENHTRHGDL